MAVSMSERDFSNFRLMTIALDRQNVYELGEGVVPEIAEHLDIELGNEPDTEELDRLVGALGKNKVLRDNEEVTAIDRDTAVELAEQSGIQKPLNRSLWTPRLNTEAIDTVIVTGGVANWQDRAAKLVEEKVDPSKKVIVAAGARTMDSKTETANPNVQAFLEAHGHYPTEAEYADEVIVPALSESHADITWEPQLYRGVTAGDEIAELVFATNPQLLDQKVGFVRVANAGIQLAVQMRHAAMGLDTNFDENPSDPQVFILTDAFPLAETAEEEGQPQSYQKAITALRQVAVTAKMLHETVENEELADGRI